VQQKNENKKMKNIILFSLILLVTISCEKKSEERSLDNLVQSLEKELSPLSENPLLWSDNDLKFLDPITNNSIIGLGEATHGTAEFSKAKHRIFKYLVENHNYKVFAFETDFGESLLINEAIQKGDSGSIENLMKTKMHFWVWRTEEVKDLLVWMCNYNLNKSDEEKVQYMGVDCQFNTFNPDMVKEYLYKTGDPFYSYAESILNEAKNASKESFKSYSQEIFNKYLKQIDDLQDSVAAKKNKLIQASSEKQFSLYERILEIVRQVSVQGYYYQKQDYTINYRDQYMAENAAWLLDYFDGKKVVIWAHNGHIANDDKYVSMGYHLNTKMANNYANIGFLFSKGTFTARGMTGNQITDAEEQVIDVDPKENSINFVMSRSKESVFSVKNVYLQNYREWNEAFSNKMQYFQIGSVFNNLPQSYYSVYNPSFFDYVIYFDRSIASVILQ
jgi:erythromycin esterase